MKTIKTEIITPNGLIFSGNALSVRMPGVEGEFGVLPGHSALVYLLEAGIIEIKLEDDKAERVAIDSGYAEISAGMVNVLAEGAVAIVGETESEIAKAIASAKELLNSAKADTFMASLEAKIETGTKER